MQPDVAGMDAFPGLQMHCHNFRHNEPFKDQRVLVVGASYSGAPLHHVMHHYVEELGVQAREECLNVTDLERGEGRAKSRTLQSSCRSKGMRIVRRKPAAGIELANHVADVAQRVFHSARTWGSHDYSEHAKPNLERVPMLTHLSPDASASFGDSQSISNIDSVIYCTGYQYKYRFLEHLNLISTGV